MRIFRRESEKDLVGPGNTESPRFQILKYTVTVGMAQHSDHRQTRSPLCMANNVPSEHFLPNHPGIQGVTTSGDIY